MHHRKDGFDNRRSTGNKCCVDQCLLYLAETVRGFSGFKARQNKKDTADNYCDGIDDPEAVLGEVNEFTTYSPYLLSKRISSD